MILKKKNFTLFIVSVLVIILISFGCTQPGTGGTTTPVAFESAVQTGGTSGTVDSTGLTLTFSVDPMTLAVSNITVTGATKGALSGTGTTRTLAISDITVENGDTISVAITSPSGFTISDSPKTTVVYKSTTPSDPILSNAKEITAFIFTSPAATGVITGTDIAVSVPHGTDVTALVATLTTTGTNVTIGNSAQTSGTTANNFNSPVIYTVTAEDTTTQDYTITVTIGIVGDVIDQTIGGETLKMIYANDQSSITFPTGTDDSGTAELSTKFWMGETEVTNAVVAVVFQWAYDNGRFSSTVGDHNGLDATTAKHGIQQLLDLDDSNCRVDYNGSGNFTAESGYENNPATNITWYGAVMFCNWLTEMRDGNTNNLVYTTIDTTWQDEETDEDTSKNGYRLPSSNEWEYAARYRGIDSINTVSGYSNPYFTKGNAASGAIADYNNTTTCQDVAVYGGQSPAPSDKAVVKSLGAGSANALGLYDMSGNVWEWFFTESGSLRGSRGGGWGSSADDLQIGDWYDLDAIIEHQGLGFRLCRSAD